jgi:hypothetical protein
LLLLAAAAAIMIGVAVSNSQTDLESGHSLHTEEKGNGMESEIKAKDNKE